MERYNFQVINFGVWLVMSFLIMILFLFASGLYLSSSLNYYDQQISSKTEELARLEQTPVQKEAERLNSVLINFKTIAGQDMQWSPYLTELARVLPVDVSIDSLVIDRETKKVEVAGRAATRESVLKLRDNILASNYFENINFPLSNLQAPRDVMWKYKFYLKNPIGVK